MMTDKLRIAELKAENVRLRDAATAFQALTVIYRTGGRPSEELFTRLDKATELLKVTKKR